MGKPLIDDVFEMSNLGFTLDSDTPCTIDPTVYVDDAEIHLLVLLVVLFALLLLSRLSQSLSGSGLGSCVE